MRPGLDENTRSALHFTLMGALLIGVLRLAYWWIGRMMLDGHPGAAILLPWRAGYLLSDPFTVVNASTALPLRLAVAVGYALLAGVLVALVVRALRFAGWVAAGRAAGAIILVLGLISALCLPPQSNTPDASTGAWRSCTRAELPGGIALPGTACCTTLERDMVRVDHGYGVMRLTLGARAVADAPASGVSMVDSTRAALAAAVLNERAAASSTR